MWRVLALSCLLGGCVSSGTQLEINDRKSFVPNARVSLTQGGEAPSQLRGGAAFELGLAQARGKSSQSLPPGQFSTLGGQTFNGPAELTNDVRATMAEAVARLRLLRPEQPIGAEFVGGVGYATFAFDVTSGGRHAAEGTGSPGFVVGLGLLWRIAPSTSAQGRLSFFGSTGWGEKAEVERWDLALVQALGRNFSVRAGYAWWDIKSKRAIGSDVRARLAGPALGVELSF